MAEEARKSTYDAVARAYNENRIAGIHRTDLSTQHIRFCVGFVGEMNSEYLAAFCFPTAPAIAL